MALLRPAAGAAGAARVEQLRLRASHGGPVQRALDRHRRVRAATCSRSSCSARASRSSSGVVAGLASVVHRGDRRHLRGLLRRRGRSRADVPRRLVPRDPVRPVRRAHGSAPAGRRAADPGRQDGHHRDRARDHRLGGDDAHRARAGALAARAPVRRARPLAGRLAPLDHAAPHPAQRDARSCGPTPC